MRTVVVLAVAGIAVGLLANKALVAWRINQVCAGGNTHGAPAHVDYGDTVAAVIGDSWASGQGLDEPTQSFAYRLAEERGWDVTVSAVAATGWTPGGACADGRSYLLRVPMIPPDAGMVLLEGGLNDDRSTDVRRHAAATLAAVRERAPAAEIVVVGPPYVSERRDADIDRVNRELRAAAADAEVRFVSTLGWQIETFDGLHPTAAGHADFARHLDDALQDEE